MGKFKWIILVDHINDGSEVGTGNCPIDEVAQLTERFQLFDDDDELYYEGASNDQNSEDAFEPLDWAMANDGCTDIKYFHNGKWESL